MTNRRIGKFVRTSKIRFLLSANWSKNQYDLSISGRVAYLTLMSLQSYAGIPNVVSLLHYIVHSIFIVEKFTFLISNINNAY